MKKIDVFKRAFLNLMLIFAMVCTTFAQTTIASWNFDAVGASPNTINVIPASTGTGTIYLNGTNGSSVWSSNMLNSFGGLNSTQALALIANSANDSSVVFVFSTTGYENINFSFQTRWSSNTAFIVHSWSYSTDGITFTTLPSVLTAPTSATFALKTADLSNITAINNQATVYLKLTVSGATASGGNNRFEDFVITGTAPGAMTNAATPTFTPAPGVLYAPAAITIECATPASTIYYTTDGSTPDLTSNLYGGPIAISANTNFKAIAYAPGFNPSNEASANYTFPVEVPNIAAFKAANTSTNSTVYKITGDVTFVHRAGRNVFVKDATGGLLIYDFSTPVISETYNNGDIISGGVCGTFTLYNGLSELVPTQPTAPGTPGTPVEPTTITVSEFLTNYANYESQLIKVEGVTFAAGTFGTGGAANINMTQGTDVTVCRNHFGALTGETPSSLNQYNVVGFAITFNTTRQLAPRNASDLLLIPVTPSVTTLPIAGAGSQNSTLASVSLTGGSANVNGTNIPGVFSWTSPTTVLSTTGIQSFSVTFTPTNTAAFLPITANVDVFVVSACVAVVPWNYGFENGTHNTVLAGCFTQDNDSPTTSNGWTFNSTNTNYNRTPRTGSFNATLRYANTRWLFKEIYLTSGFYKFSMYARQDVTSGATLTVKLGQTNTVASMDAGSLIIPETNIVDGNYQLLQGTFQVSTTGNYTIGIKGYENYSPWYISIDDLSLIQITCPQPASMAVNNVTSSSADISWIPQGSETEWTIEYKTMSDTTWATLITSSPTYVLSTLTPGTTYNVRVKSNCSATDQSEYISTNFDTKCNPLVVLPYIEDFESVVVNGFPYCFDKITTGNASIKVVQMTGTKGIEMSTGGENMSMLILPSTQASVNTLRVKFKYNGGSNHKFKFGYITDINDATTFVSLKEDSLTVNDWYYYDLFTSATLTGNERMAIVFNMGSGFSARLDSVTLMSQPACFEPINLTLTNTTTTTASFTWQYPVATTPTNYLLQYRLLGDTVWIDKINVNTPYTLTGLSHSKVYQVRVKSNCSGIGSDFSSIITFQTNCGINPVPFYEPFTSTTTPICWNNNKVDATTTSAGIFTFLTSGSSPSCSPKAGTHMARFNAYSFSLGTMGELSTPQLSGMTEGSLIKFWMYRDNGYSSNAEAINVFVNDTASSLEGTLLQTIHRSRSLAPTETADGWYQYMVRVPSGTFNRVIFQGYSAYGNNIFIDEIEVTAPIYVPVTITNGANGNSTPNGTISVLNGTVRNINFIPSVGYRVASITVNGVEVHGSDLTNSRPFAYPLNVGLDTLAVHATYEKIPYTITPSMTNYHGVNYLDNGNMPGSITPNTPTIVLHGDATTFTINVNQNFHLFKLLVDGVSAPYISQGNNTFTYTFNNVTANHTIEAIVKIDTVAIQYNVTGGAGILDGVFVNAPAVHSTWVNYGDDFLATMPAAPGYENVSTTVNSQYVGAATQYQLYDIMTTQHINVVYAPNTIQIVTQTFGNGTITPGTTFTYSPAYVYNYTVVPTTGNYIAEILVNDVPVVITDPLNFTGSLVNITENTIIKATFAPLTFTVNATAGIGGTIAPNGITSYNYGVSQDYVINAEVGYTISSVVVNNVPVTVPPGSTTFTHTFSNIIANNTISATFAINTYTITATTDANGTITPAGASTINYGSNQVYTIVPNAGYHILDVVVDGISMGPISTYTFANVMENHTIAATFAINTYTITAAINGAGTITPDGITTVNYGATQAYTIAAATGSILMDVIVDGISMGPIATYTFTDIDANHSIQAITNSATFTVTVNQPANGAITPGNQAFNYGATPVYTITPNMGYMISAITVNGAPVTFTTNASGIATYTFAPLAANATITATMAAKTFTVTSTAGANGTITPSGVATINYGANSAIYTFTPAAGYEVATVTVNGISLGALPSYQFSNVMANQTIDVTFQIINCETPINTYVTNITQTGATLNWNATGAASYDVQYKSVDAANYTLVANITNNYVDITGLTAATQYIWQVKANCTTTNPSYWSAQKSFITLPTAPDGINDQNLATVQVYSNNNNVFIINNDGVTIQNASIYDMYGKLIYSSNVISNPTVITLDVATGIYIVRLATEKGDATYKVHVTK